MTYSVITGEINYNVLYIVAGAKSVIYNSVTYLTGQQFRGVQGVRSFTYSGAGTQALYEVFELTASVIEYAESGSDLPVYADETLIRGFTIEYELTDAEKSVRETTKITGFSIELIDYPFYSFEIVETSI